MGEKLLAQCYNGALVADLWKGCRSAIFELGAKKIWLEGDMVRAIKWICDLRK